jgi:CysZ protein
MIKGLVLAFEQLGDPRIRGILIQAVLVSLAIFVALMFGLNWALSGIDVVGIGWLDAIIRVLSGAGAFVLGLMFFPAFAGLVISFMLEPIARAVEARHYPALPAAREEPMAETIANALRFTGVTVALNLLALVVIVPMLVSIVLIPFIPFVFYGLNGYLLGREYFEFASVRRLDPATGRSLRRRYRIRIFLCGLAIALLMTVPVVNWLMPVVAAAYMVHVFEDIRRGAQAA